MHLDVCGAQRSVCVYLHSNSSLQYHCQGHKGGEKVCPAKLKSMTTLVASKKSYTPLEVKYNNTKAATMIKPDTKENNYE